jgi:hypothetical protein
MANHDEDLRRPLYTADVLAKALNYSYVITLRDTTLRSVT